MFSEGISWSVGVRERERVVVCFCQCASKGQPEYFHSDFRMLLCTLSDLLRDSSNTAKVKKLMSWFTCGVSKSSV